MWKIADPNITTLFLVGSFMGGLYTLPKSIKDFENMGYKKANRAYTTLLLVKESWKWLFVLFFGIYGIFLLIAFTIQPTVLRDVPNAGVVPLVAFVSLFSYVVSSIVLTAWEKNRDFQFFMSCENCKNASVELHRMTRVKNLLDSLRWYEKYIRVVLRLRITNMEEISSKFLTQGSYEQGQTIDRFYRAFVDGDDLEPLNVIGKFAGSDGTKVLVKENSHPKWKDWKMPIAVGIMGIVGQIASVIIQSILK